MLSLGHYPLQTVCQPYSRLSKPAASQRQKQVCHEAHASLYTNLDLLIPFFLLCSIGRSWNAVELRRKSFKDLHTLWYILLRERNLLATQRAEGKRLGVIEEFTDVKEKDARVCIATLSLTSYTDWTPFSVGKAWRESSRF